MPVHEKILHLDKEKAKYCYLTFLMRFHFSVIFFHVDSCESYATLDQDERQKSGNILISLYDYFSSKNRPVRQISLPNRSAL